MSEREASLYEKLGEKRVQCHLCHHRCTMRDGQAGLCRVRRNDEGTLLTMVYGEIVAAHVDSIEKKPLYHVLPGSLSYSIATAGCNFRCDFCQNWQISQVSDGGLDAIPSQTMSPEEIVRQAQETGCRSIAYTYTEPTMFFEFALDTAKLAHEKGLKNIFVTNGYMTRGALDLLCPYLDAANVDLKSFSDNFYRRHCGARLQPVLESIQYMQRCGIWLEVTTLLLPGENDSEDELAAIADFLARADRNIPWHVTRFHPDYQLRSGELTALSALHRAQEIGEEKGLQYVYVGNVGEEGITRCPRCGHIAVRRSLPRLVDSSLKEGKCSSCGFALAGIWQRGGSHPPRKQGTP